MEPDKKVERATQTAPGGRGLAVGDPFATLSESHHADVKRVRERNRQRRLRYLLYLNVIIFAYLFRRAVEDRPLQIGLPHFGPDTWLWLFPVSMLLMFGLMLAMPLFTGRSPGMRFSPEELGVGFADVRGIDNVLEEVTRSLQIFLTYKTFREELGGNPRRGILFEGRPGTGKTHLAKAMASEAGVPFFFVSAPAFHSMWSGMTAFRIRGFFKSLKKAARKHGGAIGFIEEIDAIGGRRGGMDAAVPYGTERMSTEQMISSTNSGGIVNELLIQMQSFDQPLMGGRIANSFINLVNLFMPADHQVKKRPPGYNNVLIIAATNRADSLDPALLRPGRFDRALYFDLPSKPGRRDLVDYFLARRAHDQETDRPDRRDELAAMTIGYSPAMIEHVLDEALVWAIREGRREMSWRDIQRARLSEEIGLAQPTTYTDEERSLIATHEAGHAVTAYMCAKGRKLEVLSIIKRRQSLGLLAHSEIEERFTKTRSELESSISVSLGGMVSEEIFFGESGTGPSSDLVNATSLAAHMVGSFGMGKSLISYDAVDHGSHSTANLVAKVLSNDEARAEVEEIMSTHKEQVREILVSNRDIVEALRDELVKREELMGDEILDVIEDALAKRAAKN